jgi:hypothetical protein
LRRSSIAIRYAVSALALRRLQAPQPVVPGPAQVDRVPRRPGGFAAQLRQDVDEEGERIDRVGRRVWPRLRRPRRLAVFEIGVEFEKRELAGKSLHFFCSS